MILRPAGRFATGPLPPGDLAARFLAAVMRPPLLFLATGMGFGMDAERLIADGHDLPPEYIHLWGVTLLRAALVVLQGRNPFSAQSGCDHSCHFVCLVVSLPAESHSASSAASCKIRFQSGCRRYQDPKLWAPALTGLPGHRPGPQV